VQDRSARQARNETLHREVNERLARMDKPGDDSSEFLCECAAGDGCDARLRIKLRDYERVRQQDDRFVIAPGHENPEIERVVDRRDGYLVVDKVAELEPYVADDPRGAPSR
jgi:hypothetical protein